MCLFPSNVPIKNDKMFKKKKNVTKIGCLNKFYGHKDFFKCYFCSEKLYVMEEIRYVTPAIEIIGIYQEGILCASNESLDENEGEW